MVTPKSRKSLSYFERRNLQFMVDRMNENEVMALRKKLLESSIEDLNTDLIDMCNDKLLHGRYQGKKAKQRIWRNLESYTQRGSFRPKVKQKRKIRFAICLVACLTVCISACLASGLVPWRIAIEWNDREVSIHIERAAGIHSLSKNSYTKVSEVWGEDLATILEENGLAIDLPTWLPEGFNLDSISETKYTYQSRIRISFVNVSDVIELTIYYGSDAYNTQTIVNERDVGDIVIVDGNEAQYYIDSNIDRAASILGFDDGYATIRTTLSTNVLQKMITSIGGVDYET